MPNPTDFSAAPEQLALGGYHSCLVLDGAVRCWGQNNWGQLGLGTTAVYGDEMGETLNQLKPVDLQFSSGTRSLYVGFNHTCAVSNNNRIKCWGFNGQGQLGYGDTENRGDNRDEMGVALPAVDLAAEEAITSACLGFAHTCVLFADGNVKCFGGNDNGQLGLGDTVTRGNSAGDMTSLPFVPLPEKVTAVTCALRSTCALMASGGVVCWGDSARGQLGRGDLADIGDEPGEVSALPPIDIAPEGGSDIAEISSGAYFHCALFNDGAATCWGANDSAQLLQADTEDRGDNPDEMGSALTPLAIGTSIKSLNPGLGFACAQLADETTKCWGNTTSGKLGAVTNGDPIIGDQPNEVGANLPKLGLPATVTQLATGALHACALLDDGTLRCWGENGSGQLGIQDLEARGDQPGEIEMLPVVATFPTN